MKTLIHQGQNFPIDDNEANVNYITIEVAAPSGFEFIKVKALIDTGATVSVITTALVERLGVNDVLPYLGDLTSETANGDVKEPTTQIHLRVTGTDGKTTSFQNWPVTISKSMDEPIFGMDLLQYYAIQHRHGQIVQFAFDENSPGAIQKRKKT